LERGSTHPLAQAFQRHADVDMHAIALDEVRGEGMEGYVAGVRYRLGRPEYVAQLSGERPAEAQLVLGDASGVIATFAVADAIRTTALEAVRALRDLGLELVIASGDHHAAVEAIASQLGVEQAHARLTPERKIQLVEDLRARGKHVRGLAMRHKGKRRCAPQHAIELLRRRGVRTHDRNTQALRVRLGGEPASDLKFVADVGVKINLGHARASRRSYLSCRRRVLLILVSI